MKTLQILNGDSTLEVFLKTTLPGDTLVWREVLSEGPVSATLGDEDFFELRAKWITGAFQVTKDDYYRKTIEEFSKLKHADADEIVLWFEFDLHCQVNLLFLLNYFYKNTTQARLSLVCPSSHPNHLDFRGIGQLAPNEMAELYPQRELLNSNTLEFASEAWAIYCTADRNLLITFLQQNFEQLPTLKPALQAHLNRLPEGAQQVSRFDEMIIGLVNSGISDRVELYHAFWKNSAIYGMGDSEIDLYLDKLSKQNLIPFIKQK